MGLLHSKFRLICVLVYVLIRFEFSLAPACLFLSSFTSSDCLAISEC